MQIKNIIPSAVMILVIICFCGHYYNINSLIYVSIISIFTIAALSNLENNIIICFIAAPFFYIITSQIGRSSYVYYLAFIYIIKSIFNYIYKSDYDNLIRKYIICVAVALATFRNMFCDDPKRYISWIILTMFFIFVYNDKKFNVKKCITWYTISFIISSVFGYIVLTQGRTDILPVDLGVVFNNWNLTFRFVGLMGETNGYAQVNLILFAINIISFIKSRKVISKFKYIISCSVLIIFGFMTYSKMYTIGIGILIVLIALYYISASLKDNGNIIKVFSIFLLFAAVSLVIIKLIISNSDSSLISNYLIRFSSKDLSTGRFEVYKYFINMLDTNVLYWYLGAGFKMYLIPWNFNGLSGICAHNIYLECVVLFGVIGLGIWFSLLITRLKVSIQKKKSFLYYIPLIIYLITGLCLHSMITNYFYFLLLIIMGVIERGVYDSSTNQVEIKEI